MNVSALRCLLAVLMGVASFATAAAESEQTVPAMWKAQRVEFSYHGFTTAYDCRALEDKIERILQTVGAHSSTRASASGCEFDRVSRMVFMRLTLAAPVEATPEYREELNKDKSKQELIQRLGGGKAKLDTEEFAGVWKRVELSRDRKLNLAPGDCELMEVLRDKVFPKMAIKVEENDVRCTPNQLSMTTPKLTVSALVKAPSPDAPADKAR